MAKLGILVNSARHLGHVTGLTRAAAARRQEVILFTMDEGTRLLSDGAFTSLAELEGVTVSVCEHSAKAFGVVPERLPPKIRCGSQFNNAAMVRAADRVVVL